MKPKITILIICLFCTCLTAFSQNHVVSGTLTETDGNGEKLPVIGATVSVKGQNIGVTTDFDGRYSITTDADAVLQFQCIGYKTREINVNGRSVLDVTMEVDSEMLEDVIVVGYGTMKKSDVATSISSVKTEDMVAFPASNAVEMLRGRAPGVSVSSSSGRPGSVPSIKIRGTRSISASNSPLYVIDGSVASDTEFASINSNDIESIEILKDAASQAIYGARASDGVVLVTTKRGKSGESRISYNGYAGIQTLHRNFDFYSGDEWVEMRREARANAAGEIHATDIPLSTAIGDDMMKEVYKTGNYVDWEKLMFKKAALYHSHEVSIRGGSDKLKAAASVGYFNQDGLVRQNSGYERISARVNLDWDVKKWLTLGVNTSFNFSDRSIENGSFYQFITRTPLATVYNEDGTYAPYINSAGDKNPLFNAQHEDRKEKTNSYRVNAFANFSLFKGFSYRLNVSYYNRTEEEGRSRDAEYLGGGSTAELTNSSTIKTLLENVIQYNVPFTNTDHKLNITAVHSIDTHHTKSLGDAVQNLPVDLGYNFLASGEVTELVRKYGRNNLVSLMFRAQYGYKERYLINVAYRRDGSSRFGVNNKWGNFPSVALAWRVMEENWMKNVRFINNLKLRASYGIVGNQNGIDNYTTLGLAKNMAGEFGDVYYMGYLPGNELSNPNLKWERSATANFGLDFSVLDNRLTGTLEYYRTRTTDLLVSRSLNASLGYTSMLDNLGETKTSGIDFGLSADIIRKNNINWNVSTNCSWYRNKIVRIDDQVDADGKPMSQPGNGWIVGSPVNAYYDYKSDGVYQYEDFNISKNEAGEIVYDLKPTVDSDGDGVADSKLLRNDNVKPGSVKLKDINGDGRINEQDRKVYKRDPDFTVSLSTSFSWKGIDLYMDWYAAVGGYIRNPFLYDAEYGGSLRGVSNGVKVDYWTPNNPTNAFPRPDFSMEIPYLQSMAYQDASYLRLRTLQIGYTLPQRALKAIRCDKLRFYVTATNLLTFTDVTGYSPEVVGGGYPESKQYVFGVNLTF